MTKQPAEVLHEQLTAAGIPVTGVSGNEAPFTVTYAPEATPAQIAQGDAIVAAFDGQARQRRLIFDIRADFLALTTAQKQTVWTAFTTGNPPLWASDRGLNAAAIITLQLIGSSVAMSVADVNEAKARAISGYVQDYPNWLVHPSFDTTINIPGDEAI